MPDPSAGGPPGSPTDSPTDSRLRPRDAAYVRACPDLIRAHPHTASWFNDATFVFPFLAFAGVGIAYLLLGGDELLGITLFFALVTLAMGPLVWTTWQRTPTVIVLREGGIEAVHQGRLREALDWSAVSAVTRADTLGNLRWYITGPDGDHLTIEGEIADIPALIAEAQRRAGLPDDPAVARRR